ncbi:MAG: DNA primase [Firmicutes bacterium]|nr:DNA primase [Bacillota bacterium]
MGFNSGGATIEDLKSQINIVDVIGRVVPLKRAGANYKGVCPFHNEKTPSFVVSEQKQIFTCFGCGATGDVIEFTKRYYNLDFGEAVEKLAKEHGIELKIAGSGGNQEREKYYEVNKEAARFFYRAFTEGKNAGYTYMKKRGIEDAILKKFGIGYADESWDSLYQYFRAKGVEEKILLELGLISEKNGKYYDKFRNRVIFPIINTSGKVIGFGGRAIGDAMPKYLNSPENKIFQKKNNIYALNTTKQDVGKEGYAILVEGYMDVISLYQGGVRNVGASLGTALTENQAKLLKRYTRNVILSYDADAAGQAAAVRGLEVLSAEDIKVKVLHVTDGKDPDEYIKKNGKEAFLKLVSGALPMIDYKLNAAKRELDLSTEDGKIDYIKKASEILRKVSPASADIYIKKLSHDLKIAEGAIRMEILGNNNNVAETIHVRKNNAETESVQYINNLEATLLKVLLVNPYFSEKMLEYQEVFESDSGRKVLNLMFEKYGLSGTFELSDIMDNLEPEESKLLTETLDGIIVAGNEEQVFDECIKKWKLNQAVKKEQELINRLSLADEETSSEAIKQLTGELMQVQKEINSFGGRK